MNLQKENLDHLYLKIPKKSSLNFMNLKFVGCPRLLKMHKILEREYRLKKHYIYVLVTLKPSQKKNLFSERISEGIGGRIMSEEVVREELINTITYLRRRMKNANADTRSIKIEQR